MYTGFVSASGTTFLFFHSNSQKSLNPLFYEAKTSLLLLDASLNLSHVQGFSELFLSLRPLGPRNVYFLLRVATRARSGVAECSKWRRGLAAGLQNVRNGHSSLPLSRRGARNGCSRLLQSCRGSRNCRSSLPTSIKDARNGGSRLPRRGRMLEMAVRARMGVIGARSLPWPCGAFETCVRTLRSKWPLEECHLLFSLFSAAACAQFNFASMSFQCLFDSTFEFTVEFTSIAL